MKIILNVFVFTFLITFLSAINVTKKTDDDDNTYFFVNYDYNDNETIDVKSLVFPTSEDRSVDYEDHGSDFELPDDSLADSDLKDHDIIDSIPYLYSVKPIGINSEYTTILIAIEFTINGIVLVYGVVKTFSQLIDRSQVGSLIHLQLLVAMVLFNLLLLLNLSTKSENMCKLVAFGINYSQSIIIFWVFTYICFMIREAGIQYGLLTILYSYVCLGGSLVVLLVKLEPVTFGKLCFLPGGFTTALVPAMLFAIVLWILRYKDNNIFLPRIWNLYQCKKSKIILDNTISPNESQYEKLLQLEANDEKIIKEEFLTTPEFGKYNMAHAFILITYIATFSTLYISRYEMARCIASIVATVFICCFCKVDAPTVQVLQEGTTIVYIDEVENNYETYVPEILN